MGKDKPPAPMVTLTQRGLIPLDAYDAEAIAADPKGTEYDLVKRSKRNWPHLKKYWKCLHMVVANDDRWPTASHLHDDLKLACGYVRQCLNFETGELSQVVDSIAFDKMTQPEFEEYYNRAFAKLASVIGYDPLALLPDVAA
ncbi:hypothetical protein JY97_00475 [Alkalispirochaeta odontotermitis]|nr:hypothetical protein JY97_00475 [Alkalispirochaeta odontotermitis]